MGAECMMSYSYYTLHICGEEIFETVASLL